MRFPAGQLMIQVNQNSPRLLGPPSLCVNQISTFVGPITANTDQPLTAQVFSDSIERLCVEI